MEGGERKGREDKEMRGGQDGRAGGEVACRG